jgi:steroid 5-alpha reductase family enzyme
VTGLQFAAVALAASAALSALMAGAWLIWRHTRNSGWVDVTWTFGLGAFGALGALAPALSFGTATARQILVTVLVACWSLRLGFHIAQRTMRITDDPRYAKLLCEWGADATQQMFWLLQKQALVSIPLALSMLVAAWNPAPGLRTADILGALVLGVGVLGESIADRQLRAFRADPANRNRICDAGLWRWSRHPNYFFQWFGWLGYPLLAIVPGGDYAWGWLALAGPAGMYWLLVYVSGIPPLEAHMLERRRDAFRAYQARTSAFFPMPPRNI